MFYSIYYNQLLPSAQNEKDIPPGYSFMPFCLRNKRPADSNTSSRNPHNPTG